MTDKALSKVEINRLIHEKVMGEKLTHMWVPANSNVPCKEEVCAYCKCGFTSANDASRCEKSWGVSDYCTDLNAVAEVEAKVVNQIGFEPYAVQLALETHVGIPILATAQQRALACLKAIGEKI